MQQPGFSHHQLSVSTSPPPPAVSLSSPPNEAPSRHVGADVVKKNRPLT